MKIEIISKIHLANGNIEVSWIDFEKMKAFKRTFKIYCLDELKKTP